MKRAVGLVSLLCMVVVLGAPLPAFADSLSVTQVITITARVAPARSIVVNDKGQITKIYSNTAQEVIPKVYVNDIPGPEWPLTVSLLRQYRSIMAQQSNVVGVEIPVAPPIASSSSVWRTLARRAAAPLKGTPVVGYLKPGTKVSPLLQ